MSKPSAHEALIYLMVIVSASDRDMGDEELARIGAVVRTLPVFRGFEQARTLLVAQECQKLLQQDTGFAGMLETIRDSLAPALRETAYALAVDIAAADLEVRIEEERMLDILKARLGVDPLAAAAIERAAAIRHRTTD